LTLLHFAQAAVILVLAGSFAITVTSSIPAGPPGTAVPAPTAIFEVPIGWAVALFLGLAALDHLLTATVSRSTYEHDFKAGINRFRTPPAPSSPLRPDTSNGRDRTALGNIGPNPRCSTNLTSIRQTFDEH